MTNLRFKLSVSLIFSLVLTTPFIVCLDLVQAANSKQSVAVDLTTPHSVNLIKFSSNLDKKIQAIAAKKEKVKKPQFRLFDNGPDFVQNQPYQGNNRTNHRSAVAVFDSLLD